MIGKKLLYEFSHDALFGLRAIRKHPRFAVGSIFVLAVGIGASTVIFSAFYNLLFNAFAARDPRRLAVPVMTSPFVLPVGVSLPKLDAIRSQNHVFEDIVGYKTGFAIVRYGPRVSQLSSAQVTANAFGFYGVPPLVGRGIVENDGEPGSPKVFVSSYQTWKNEFGSDVSFVGNTFTVDGEQRTLVGVMPPRFHEFGPRVQIWMPFRNGDPNQQAQILTRLKPGVTLKDAAAELTVIIARLAGIQPRDLTKRVNLQVQSATDFFMGPYGMGSSAAAFDVKRLLYNVLGASIVLLLIACMNVANLLLTRATVREREIAIRFALGATRGRLVRQLLAESSLLALGACTLGCLLAYFGTRGIAAVIPQNGSNIGGEAVIRLDPTVLAFSLGITTLTFLIYGLAPALRSVSHEPSTTIAESSKATSGSLRHGKLRGGLIVTEVALSVILLVGAGLLIRSFFILATVDLGFSPKNLIVAALSSPADRDSMEERHVFWEKVAARLKELPGVAHVAVHNSLPGYDPGSLRTEAHVPGTDRSEQVAFNGCSESYMETLGLKLLRGSWFSRADIDSRLHVVVINETLARGLFNGADPVGRLLELKSLGQGSQTQNNTSFQIVGVVADFKNFGPQSPPKPMGFLPYTITGAKDILIRSTAPPVSLMHPIQEQIWEVDPNVIFHEFKSLEDMLYEYTYSVPELGVAILGPLAAIAFLLSTMGVFSVVAYTVSLRTREVGIRMALGARPKNVLTMILGYGMRLVIAGILVGTLLSTWLMRFFRSHIWGVSTMDPLTFSAVVVLIMMSGLIACFLAGKHATRVDPLIALRHE